MISGLFSLPLTSAEAAAAPPRAGVQSIAEHFIAGPENALVRTLAAAAVAEPLDYNPIVLLGPIGVGKTSLAHALAAQRRQALALKNVVATTGADLARALAHAIETDATDDLRAKYHRCDLLLLDDLQQLAGKDAAQQFLLTTLDALLRRGSLVIVTMTATLVSQAAGADLSSALSSRLAGGLSIPLVPPGSLARRELVQQYAARVSLALSDEVIAQLAGSGDKPTRRPPTAAKLRQVVMQLGAVAKENHGHIRSAQIARLLATESPEIKAVCRQVMSTVAKHFALTLADLRGKSREQTVAEARGLAMYIARQLTGASYAEIGRQFGSRDHTTVLHACRKLSDLIATDDVTRRLADELTAQASAEAEN